jgi:hypothetical protein
VDVDLCPDRDLQEIRSTPRFLELYGELWNLLRLQTVKSDTAVAD